MATIKEKSCLLTIKIRSKRLERQKLKKAFDPCERSLYFTKKAHTASLANLEKICEQMKCSEKTNSKNYNASNFFYEDISSKPNDDLADAVGLLPAMITTGSIPNGSSLDHLTATIGSSSKRRKDMKISDEEFTNFCRIDNDVRNCPYFPCIYPSPVAPIGAGFNTDPDIDLKVYQRLARHNKESQNDVLFSIWERAAAESSNSIRRPLRSVAEQRLDQERKIRERMKNRQKNKKHQPTKNDRCINYGTTVSTRKIHQLIR